MKRVTDQARLVGLLAEFSIREIARRLGVHHKTVQRWRDGERAITKNRPLLVKQSGNQRARNNRAAAKQGYRPAPTPVAVKSKRTKRIDPHDPSQLIDSDAVDYETPLFIPEEGEEESDLDKAMRDTAEAAITHYREKALYMGRDSSVRFLIRGDPTPDYPRGVQWTAPISITGKRTAKQIVADAMKKAGAFGAIIETRIVDPALKK